MCAQLYVHQAKQSVHSVFVCVCVSLTLSLQTSPSPLLHRSPPHILFCSNAACVLRTQQQQQRWSAALATPLHRFVPYSLNEVHKSEREREREREAHTSTLCHVKVSVIWVPDSLLHQSRDTEVGRLFRVVVGCETMAHARPPNSNQQQAIDRIVAYKTRLASIVQH